MTLVNEACTKHHSTRYYPHIMATGPKSFDFRESTRTPVRTEVQLQFDRDEDVVGFSANLSPGGIFVTVRDPKPIGTLLRFVISLQGGDSARGYGEVVWIRVKYHGPDRPSGMGIRFRHLEDDGAQRVEEFILRMTDRPHEAETGDDTVAAAPEAEPAAGGSTSAREVPWAGAVPPAAADPDATLAATPGEVPVAELWMDEASTAADLAASSGTEELASDATSRLLLPPTEPGPAATSEVLPPLEDVLVEDGPAEEVDTAVYEELVAPETVEFSTALVGDETVAAEESSDEPLVDTAVIVESALRPGEATVAAPQVLPAGQAGARVGTDELSAAFGDLYPAGQQGDLAAQVGQEIQDAAQDGSISTPGHTTHKAESSSLDSEPKASSVNLQSDREEEVAQQHDELPRAAPWLTTPTADEELEETLDGLLRQADSPAAVAQDEAQPVVPKIPAAERSEGSSQVWTQLPRESKRLASGLPPGSSRTAIAGAAMAEEKWKKTFFGMPSRTFLRLLAVLALVAVLGFFFAGRMANWLSDHRSAEPIASSRGDKIGQETSRPSEPPVQAPSPPAVSPGDSTSEVTPAPTDMEPTGATVVDASSSDQVAANSDVTGEPAGDETTPQYSPAPLLAPADGGLDLSRLQLAEGMTVRRALTQHDRPATARTMRQVTDLVWRQRGGETIVTITGDGALEAGRYTQEKMAGAQPRVLIRVRGIRREFPQPTTKVDTPQLSVIRLGYHQAAQRELHVVLDLPHENVQVRGITLTGAGLEVHLSSL